MTKHPNLIVFILYVHRTQGVLRQKIWEWLKHDKQWVKNAKLADPSNGGNAFIELGNICTILAMTRIFKIVLNHNFLTRYTHPHPIQAS